MKKQLTLLFAIPALSLGSAWAAGNASNAPIPANATPTTSSNDTAGFTTAQQAAIGKIASDYIVKHPEVLIQASQALQAKQQAAMQTHAKQIVVQNAKQLISDPMSPVAGNPQGKVALIEFFDYQCAYCHKEAPFVEQVLSGNKDVKYVAKMFPIFAQRWPASDYAAQIGYVAAKQGKFAAYHNAIFDSGLMEGKLTKDDINKFAKKAGVNISALSAMTPVIKKQMQKDMQLAGTLGLQGTPGLIVMPNTASPDPSKVTVFFGYTQADALTAAIKKADS